MIKSSIEKHTIGWMLKKYNQGLLNTKITIQRREVWDLEHKSNLIVSFLLGVPIESLLFEEEGANGYKVLDGLQRLLAVVKYLNGEFVLASTIKVTELDGVSLVGKSFSELPTPMQDILCEFELSISVLRPLTNEERGLVFVMRNQALPLTKFELTRVVLGIEILKELNEVFTHPFLMTKTAISQSALNRYENQQTVLKCMILQMRKDYSFSGKDLNLFAEELNHTGELILTAVKQSIIKVFDYLDQAIPEKNRNLKKIHLPMLYKVTKFAIRDNVQPEKFNQWVETFFVDLNDGKLEKYSQACESSSAKKSNVLQRLQVMEEHYANANWCNDKEGGL